MSKERLIELKSKLESKYVSYDGSDASGAISQYELEQKQNVQGAITNLENYFESLITKLELNGKLFDELMISAVYKLFYKYEDIDEVLNTTANVNPLKDLIVVSFGCYKAINGDEQYDSDPEDIYKGCYDEYIVSFDELKIALEQNGFDVGTIKSFDEIENIINNGKIPVTFFSIKFTKNKRLVKE